VNDEMINTEVERLQVRNGNMTEPEAVENDENVLNVTFTESAEDGNTIEGGITKDNSLLIKYFSEEARKKFIGKKNGDTVTIQLSKAFEAKELDIIIGDLGLLKQDTDKYFNLTITKVGAIEKAALDETFFTVTYPNQAITNEAEFKAAVKKDIEGYYDAQSRNQIHDQIYHALIDNTKREFPADFLKRWLQTGGEKQRTMEEAEKEYPIFQDQLKWTLISTQLISDHKVEVVAEDLKAFAKQQLMSYMGGQLGALGDNDQWLEDYATRMMQDRKFVEDSYQRISTDKLFQAIESNVTVTEEQTSAEKFAEKLQQHHH
jgi:trigger factor